MILADDHSYRDFGFMGNKAVQTPHLDRLASQSARYSNGYVPMSVCRPSLATLMTGLYPHQHGIHFNHPPPGLKSMRNMTAEQYRATRAKADYLIESVPTLPRILADAGYSCLQTGKHWEGNFRTAGFTHGMALGMPADRLSSITGTRAQVNGEWVAHGNGDAGLVIGRETMEPIRNFIKANADHGPFFIWYAPFLPHTPFNAPQRFRDIYNDSDVAEELLPYYAEISRFDETVGQLLRLLENRDLMKNTLIVFASDNGFRPDKQKHERQNKRSKLSQFDDGLRTPILIRWDGRVKPDDHLRLTQTVDLVPTILNAVGLSNKATRQMKGIDLMPSAEGRHSLPKRAAFGAIYPNDAVKLSRPAMHVRGRWIRHENFKLVIPGSGVNRLALSLFDLHDDPEELRNLADLPEHGRRIQQLTEQLNDWWNPVAAEESRR